MRKIFLFLLPLFFCVFTINAQSVNSEENAAISLVSASKASLGLSAEDLSNVMVSSTYFDNASGVRRVYLIQTYKGIPVYNQMLVLAFKGDKLVSKTGAFKHSLEKFTNVQTGMPSVSAESAVQSALSDRGLHASQMAIAINRKDNGRKVEFGNMGISHENITAQLIWAPIENSNEIHLAWQVYIIPKTSSDYWMIRVDAVNNSIIGIDNYTDYDNWGTPDVNAAAKYPAFMMGNIQSAENDFLDFKKAEDPSVVTTATYRVVPYPAEAPSFPNGAHALRTDPWLAAPGNATSLKWNTGAAATDYNYTRGNNVWAYEDRTAPTNTGTVAKSAASTTALPNLTFDYTPNYTVDPTQTTPVPNQQFNITNLFYWNNVIHDILYQYGFDEPAGNFQDDNQGRGGAGNDHVNGEAQDGGGTNNANFATPADGGSGRMQMYLWTGGTPNRDGDVDNGIVIHEFGHGLSNRLTGGPAAAGCLGNAEQMGEGWSDYYGLMLTQDWATATLNTGFNSPRGIGTYALFQPTTGLGIRTQRYCTDFTVNSKVYLASLPTGPHPRGEIWCATLWDMTWNIINQVGTINANLYNVAGGGGNTIALKLVTEGMKLQQCSPGFISGRDAILQADQILYGGLYNCAIWEAFRRRGMGAFASEGSTASVTDQVPDFTPPLTLGATVSATTIPEGQNLNYINSVTTCSAVTGYTLRDTLPLNVTYISGGVYDAANRVVSFAVNQAAGTSSYPFTVNVNAGSYFPPVSLINEPVAGATIPASWTTSAPLGNVWSVANTQSNSAPNSFYVENLPADGDQRLETTTAIALPASSYPKLSFWHRFNTEDGWDGGVVEISNNGGTTWTDLGANMITGGYNGGLGVGPNNPIGGRPAFTGLTAGAAFMNTIVNLSAYAGQSVKIRFRFGSDNNTTAPTLPAGWWVDDITLDAIAAVPMRSSLFNAANARVFYKDLITEITQVVVCAPTINQHPVDASACVGSSVSFTCVGVATGGVTYQWQLSTTGVGGTYSNLSNVAPYSGVTTSTLTVNPAAIGMDGYFYRCVVTGACAPNATSSSARLTVAAVTVAGSVTPANTQVCGTTNSGTLTLSGHNGSVLRWESATNLAGPWTAIVNTGTTYIFNNLTQTTYFRAVVQFGSCASDNSSVATVTFVASSPIVILADPGTTLCAGDPTLLTVHEGSFAPGSITLANQTATFTGNVRGYWFTAPTAFTITSMIVPTTASAGTQNIAVVKFNGNVPPPVFAATTNAFTTLFLTQNNATAGSIPVNIPIAAGEVIGIMGNRANINSYTTGSNSITIGAFNVPIVRMGMQFPLATTAPQALWQEPASTSITRVLFDYSVGSVGPPVSTGTFLWSPAAGLSSTTSNPVAASPMVTTTYTVRHDDGVGCVRQTNITITVKDRPAVTAQPANTSVCSGIAATFTVGATAAGITYQWQVSTTGTGGPWTNLANTAPYSGVTTTTLTVNPTAVSMNGYAYRCVISGDCPPSVNSNAAVLTVVALPTVSISPVGPICGGVAGTNGIPLTASGASSYFWSPVSGLYLDAGATTPYTGSSAATVYAAPKAFTVYTVTGTSTSTGCANTASISVNYTPPAPTVTPSSVAMCLGDLPVRLTSSSSFGTTITANSGPVSIIIPDGTGVAGISTLAIAGVPAGLAMGEVKVSMNITHSWAGDVDVNIKAPNNAVLNLVGGLDNGGGLNSTANFTNTAFSSLGGATISGAAAPRTGTYAAEARTGYGPTGYIQTVNNWAALTPTTASANGNWTLAMGDFGNGDVGTLTSWSISVTYITGVPSTTATWSPVAGLFNDALATIPYAGTARDTVWAQPTTIGANNYDVTVQSLSLPPTEIQTTFANNNASGLVTSNITNTNAFPITITGIESVASTSVASTATLYYKVTPINGLPGAITAANGWLVAGTGTYTSVANTTTTVPQTMLSGLSFVIPPGATYGIAMESKNTVTGVGNLRYSTVAAGTYTNSAGGVDLISGSNVSYGGAVAPTAPTFTPRAFIGKVLFGANFTPCTSPARRVVVTVNQPTTLNTNLPANAAVCTDKVVTFTAAVTVGTGPHGYQWQVSTNGGTTFANIANGGVYSGATAATLTITAPPVTMNTYQYRCVVTGAAPCAAATSRIAILTVNPLPTVLIVANRTSLLPGLTATLSSAVTPNAAASYTWLRNGTPVSGAISSTLVVDVDRLGDYSLRVTDVNNCTNTSNTVTIKDSVSGKCFIYPNPTSGKFQVRYYSVANNRLLPRTLTIFDAKGDRVFTQLYTIGQPYDRMDVDMRAYGKGLYWVEIGDANGNRITMCRVVIQ